MKDEIYYFHQTPPELSKKLIEEIQFDNNDNVLEPFKGEGSFYNNLPNNINKFWCEIEEGRDYKDDNTQNIDWVISNPPFRLEKENGNRENSFYHLLNHYSTRVNKGIAFLGNDYCLSTLTPNRLKKLNNQGLYLHKIIVCSVKKWRGRYFFIIFKKEQNNFYKYIEGNF
jgi:hypothetical protein